MTETRHDFRLDVTAAPQMAHMRNFADTRARLWDRFCRWLPVVTSQPGTT